MKVKLQYSLKPDYAIGTQALYYNTVDVLTDADCVKDNNAGPDQDLVFYQAPNMTCTPFEGTPGTLSVCIPLIAAMNYLCEKYYALKNRDNMDKSKL